MTDRSTTGGPLDPVEPTRIDISVAHPARVYDYILGGKDNFSVDREAAEHMAAAFPGGFPAVKAVGRAFRAFLGRTLRLSIDAGIRQFLDFGTGLPTGRRTHDVAQELAPESRVVYVDPDPLVLAHSHTLHTGTPEGATAYIQGELRDAERVLEKAAERTLDFTRPVAVRLYCLLNLETDPEQAYGVVERLMDAVVPGSHLVLAAVCDDLLPEAMEVAQRLTDTTCETWVARSHAEVQRFFDGLELVEPGLVPINRWRVPEPDSVDQLIPIYGAVGRKP